MENKEAPLALIWRAFLRDPWGSTDHTRCEAVRDSYRIGERKGGEGGTAGQYPRASKCANLRSRDRLGWGRVPGASACDALWSMELVPMRGCRPVDPLYTGWLQPIEAKAG